MKFVEQGLMTRPRALNVLHRFHLARPCTGTNDQELARIAFHARGKRKALEIGTFQGVSAARIAAAMAEGGVLYCVDPWFGATGEVDPTNPCWQIAERHFRRTRTVERIKILRGTTAMMADQIPYELDFAFIDGDHSWRGIEADWKIVPAHVAKGGVICLHDTVLPAQEPWRKLDSMDYFEQVISKDPAFEFVEAVHSLTVLRRMS